MNQIPSAAQELSPSVPAASAAESATASKFISRTLVVIVVVGAALRLMQYLGNAALSLDEIALARNVLERDLGNLLTAPLGFDQSAPKGFLLITKVATILFGSSDYALRLVPLICSLVSLIVFWRVAPRILEGAGAPMAMALFAVAMPLLAYATVVKQYAGDVLVSVLLLWLALHLTPAEITRRCALWTGVAGAIAVWFSQPSVFVLLGLSIALVLIHRRSAMNFRSRNWTMLTPTLILWGAAVLAAVATALGSMTPETHDYMTRYWAAGLLPSPAIEALASFWPWQPLTALFGSEAAAGLGYPKPSVYVLLTAVGYWYLWRRRRDAALLLLLPLAITLSAAIARQYPFIDRLILFLVPSFFLAIAAAVEGMRRLTAKFSTLMAAAVTCLALGPAIYSSIETPPVYQMENIKPILAHLQAKRAPGDGVYVYYGAVPAVRFYEDEYGLSKSDYVLGACHRGSNQLYLEELDNFRGSRRLWIVITHAFRPYRERDDVLRYLDVIGSRLEAFTVEANTIGARGLAAEIFLYDLSDPRRLRQASARSFHTTGPNGAHPRFTCDEGPQVMTTTTARSKSLH